MTDPGNDFGTLSVVFYHYEPIMYKSVGGTVLENLPTSSFWSFENIATRVFIAIFDHVFVV